jgi:hypothetical protein
MKRKRPALVKILFACIIFQGISGLFGGSGLIIDPTGESLNIPLSWLEGSPFTNYLIPGLILFLLLGILPIYIAIGLFGNRFFYWLLSLILGILLLIWIVVEIIIIGYQPNPPLQLVYGILGVLIVALSLQPKVKNHFR